MQPSVYMCYLPRKCVSNRGRIGRDGASCLETLSIILLRGGTGVCAARQKVISPEIVLHVKKN
jgi:hypothetical protein